MLSNLKLRYVSEKRLYGSDKFIICNALLSLSSLIMLMLCRDPGQVAKAVVWSTFALKEVYASFFHVIAFSWA